MAKKTTRKYRQAKAEAKPAAKKAFAGKTKAVRRDPMAKYSAEDREIFKEISKESKGRYITDDQGRRIEVKPTETARERIARERATALRKFREEATTDETKTKARADRMEAKRQEIIKKNEAAKAASKGKSAPGLLQSAPAEKKQTAKVPAKKAVIKKAAAKPKGTVGTVSKPDAKGVAKVVKEAKTIRAAQDKTKAATPKKAPVYNITTAQPEKAAKGSVKPKFVQKKAPVAKPAAKAVAKPETGKAVAVRAKGTVATTAKSAAVQAAKKGGAAAALKGAGRVAGKLIGGRVGMAITAAALAKPVLKALVKEPAGAKKTTTTTPPAKTKDYSVKREAVAKGRVTAGAGGSTTTTGSSYTVKKGDTLSGIAKQSNVSLAELRAANPEIMKKKKYKQGAMIWSGTKVRIPKK